MTDVILLSLNMAVQTSWTPVINKPSATGLDRPKPGQKQRFSATISSRQETYEHAETHKITCNIVLISPAHHLHLPPTCSLINTCACKRKKHVAKGRQGTVTMFCKAFVESSVATASLFFTSPRICNKPCPDDCHRLRRLGAAATLHMGTSPYQIKHV